MPLNVPLLEEALVYVLRNPDTVIPATHADSNRREAAADLAAMDYTVHWGYRPQNNKSTHAVTLERLSGLHPINIDSFANSVWPLVDLTTWTKTDGPRTIREESIRLGQLLRIFLLGLNGTFRGVEICTINLENEPFESDDTPGDASDDWVSSYVYPYQIIHKTTNASHNTATGV